MAPGRKSKVNEEIVDAPWNQKKGGLSDVASRELAELVIKLYMGDECSQVIKLILREKEGVPLSNGTNILNRGALSKLMIHGIVEEYKGKYWSHVDKCCELLGSSRAIDAIAQTLGLNESKIIEILFCQGVATSNELREISGGSNDALIRVIRNGLIAPTINPHLEDNEEHLFEENNNTNALSTKKKIIHTKNKWTISQMELFINKQNLLWRLELPALRRRRLRFLCLSFVKSKMNDQASKFCDKLFDFGAWRFSKDDQNCNRVLFHQLPDGIKKDRIENDLHLSSERDADVLMRYANFLACDQIRIIKFLPDNKIIFDAFAVISEIRKLALFHLINARYGQSAARIFNLLLDRNAFIEQAEIAEHALVPPKEAREKLYQLWTDKFVQMNEFAQSNAPKDSIFLWCANLQYAHATFLANTRLALRNCLLRRNFELAHSSPPHDLYTIVETSSPLRNNQRIIAITNRLDKALLDLHDASSLFYDPPTF
mmetsp:Transcript_1977/g.3011  ORF Transcript_1977/g.3011 Transcript_1977/m.3011 type:complete len:487 (-) Transcript_1977:692-2152(-)